MLVVVSTVGVGKREKVRHFFMIFEQKKSRCISQVLKTVRNQHTSFQRHLPLSKYNIAVSLCSFCKKTFISKVFRLKAYFLKVYFTAVATCPIG